MATSNTDQNMDIDIMSAKDAYALATSLVVGLAIWVGVLALIV